MGNVETKTFYSKGFELGTTLTSLLKTGLARYLISKLHGSEIPNRRDQRFVFFASPFQPLALRERKIEPLAPRVKAVLNSQFPKKEKCNTKCMFSILTKNIDLPGGKTPAPLRFGRV